LELAPFPPADHGKLALSKPMRVPGERRMPWQPVDNMKLVESKLVESNSAS
jgi:hypothetical protein